MAIAERGQRTSANMANASKHGRTGAQNSGYSMFRRQPLSPCCGQRYQIDKSLIDLAGIRQHKHVGERFPLAKTAARLTLLDDLVEGVLAERQVQAQLLGGDAEHGERRRLADGDGAFARAEAAPGSPI